MPSLKTNKIYLLYRFQISINNSKSVQKLSSEIQKTFKALKQFNSSLNKSL